MFLHRHICNLSPLPFTWLSYSAMISLSFLNLGVDIFCRLVSRSRYKLLVGGKKNVSGILKPPPHPSPDEKSQSGEETFIGKKIRKGKAFNSSWLLFALRISGVPAGGSLNPAPATQSSTGQRASPHSSYRRRKKLRNFPRLCGRSPGFGGGEQLVRSD